MAAAPPRLASPLPRIGGNYAIQSSDTPTTRHQGASHGAKPLPQPASCAASPTRPGRRADWRDNVATLKPTTPLLAPNKGPLKPPSPLRPKTAPKKPISHPQRRWRFQSRLGRRPQRRRRFQPHTDTSKQRRHRFQESGPPGLQDPDAIPVAGGGPWPGDQWAADVTNVVKPTRFKSPRENPCYKRRQSKPKNQHFQRKSR